MAAASSTPVRHYSTKISVERFSFYAALKYGLVGYLLLDLVLQGKLEIDNNNRVIGAIAGNTGSEFLDQRLSEVLALSRPLQRQFSPFKQPRLWAQSIGDENELALHPPCPH